MSLKHLKTTWLTLTARGGFRNTTKIRKRNYLKALHNQMSCDWIFNYFRQKKNWYLN